MFKLKSRKNNENKRDEEEMSNFKEDVNNFPAWLRFMADDLEREISCVKPNYLILQTKNLKKTIEQITSRVSWMKWRVGMFENARDRQTERSLGLRK